MSKRTFHCSHCGVKLNAGFDKAGESFDCPKCANEVTVPGYVDNDDDDEQSQFWSALSPVRIMWFLYMIYAMGCMVVFLLEIASVETGIQQTTISAMMMFLVVCPYCIMRSIEGMK